MSPTTKRQVHLAASIAGVNHWTLWGHPDAQSQISIAAFLEQAQTAERGLFDFFFVAEGLRLREYFGRIHDLDVVGRPDNLTVLAALAGATRHIGLIATVSATYTEPYDLARRLASLDHLSRGRAGWNIVTSSDAFTGANFRRGAYLDYSERYSHAREFVALARALWDSDAPSRDSPDAIERQYSFDGEFYTTSGAFTLARSPQRYPVFMQAGDSGDGRDFAVDVADLIFTLNATHPEGTEFVADIRQRASDAGRDPNNILVFPMAEVVLGDTNADALELQREVSRQQISPATARNFLGIAWGTELVDIDVDVAPPEPTPPTEGECRGSGTDQQYARAKQWYEEAIAEKWSVRDLIVAKHTKQVFVGTASSVAEQIDNAVQNRVADGFIVGTPAAPTGLGAFVDSVVPILQERGVYRSGYEGNTLRENLGLRIRTKTDTSERSSRAM